MKEKEVRKMLAEIFTEKPDAPICDIPGFFQPIIEEAKELGLTWFPKMFVEEIAVEFTGRLDLNSFNEPVIIVAHFFKFVGAHERSVEKMQKTLAHELGHCFHMEQFGFNIESWGWKNCEAFAEAFAENIIQNIN